MKTYVAIIIAGTIFAAWVSKSADIQAMKDRFQTNHDLAFASTLQDAGIQPLLVKDVVAEKVESLPENCRLAKDMLMRISEKYGDDAITSVTQTRINKFAQERCPG